MADKNRSTDVKVGLFVTAGVVVFVAILFILGQERHLFEEPVFLRTFFQNVAGLKVGAPVRLSGVDVGIVSAIEFPRTDPDPNAAMRIVPQTPAESLVENGTLAIAETQLNTPSVLMLTGFVRDGLLETDIRVEGEGLYNEKVEETFSLRARSPSTAIVGVHIFHKIDRVVVIKARGQTSGSAISLGVASGRLITVVMRINHEVLDKVRRDSEVRVDSMGLLGDKTIDISIGSPDQSALKSGDLVRPVPSVDVNAAVNEANRILQNVVDSTEQLNALLRTFVGAGGDKTMLDTIRALQAITDEIQNGRGLIHQIIFDPKTGSQYKDIVGTLNDSMKKLDDGLAQLGGIVKDVREGDGMLHTAIYDKRGTQLLTDLNQTVVELNTLIKNSNGVVTDVKSNNSFVHNMLYNDDRGEVMSNLNETTAALTDLVRSAEKVVVKTDAIVADVQKGKGTLGALLVDPSVYQDLKVLLGNVRRNDAVRALVRYSVEEQEKRAAQPVTEQQK